MKVLEGLDEFPQVLEEYINCTDSVGDGMDYSIFIEVCLIMSNSFGSILTQALVKPDN